MRLFRTTVPGMRALALLSVALLAHGALAQFTVTGEAVGYDNESPISFVQLQVRNRTGAKMPFTLSFEGGFAMNGEVELEQMEIEPDGERVLNVPVPLMNSPTVTVTSRSGVERVGLNRGGHQGIVFLNVTELSGFAGEKEIDEFSKAYYSASHGHHYYSSGSGPGNRVVSQMEPQNLPENWQCYTPFRAVFVQESVYHQLPAGARSALLRWVDAGGRVVVYGAEETKSERRMHGSIVHQSQNPVSYTSLPPDWLRSRPQWHGGNMWQTATGTSAEDTLFPYRIEKMAGASGAFALTSIFLLIAGPVNYFYYRRKGQIRRVMVSLPVISIAFCVFIMIYFVATQGFSRKGGSFAVTVLDESRGDALTMARHSVFSGLYPLGGFRFDRGTAFVPLRKAEDFEIGMGATTHLRSGIFEPTANFNYVTVQPRTTREKLIYKSAGRELVNGFEKPIETLLVNDGNNWYIGRDIPAGSSTRLESVTPEQVQSSGDQAREQLIATFRRHCTRWSEQERNYLTGTMAPYMRVPLPGGIRYMISFDETDGTGLQSGLAVDNFAGRHVLISTASAPLEDEAGTAAPAQGTSPMDVQI